MDYLAKIKNDKLRRVALLMKAHWGRLQISHQAAELAYFALLALFPTLLVFGNLIPLLPIPKDELLAYLALTLPKEISEVINPIMSDYLSGGNGQAISIGILISIWTSSKAFSVFQKVLNQVYNTTVRKNIIVQRMFSFIIAFLMVVIIALVAFIFMFGNYILAFLGDIFPIQIAYINAFDNLRWVGAFFVIWVLLTYIYYFVPNVYWSIKFSIPGALFSTVAFLMISQLFSSYVGFAARQAAGNGAVGVFIILMLWLYLLGIVLILGGFLNVMLYYYFRPLKEVLREENRYVILYSAKGMEASIKKQALKRRLIRRNLIIVENDEMRKMKNNRSAT
ncbi:virulence factor brkb [Trichococcus palustris]|uniref:Virulence factor brkb n=1 Tax=Trichococcus palustris TaxID=140314 RepID=A0A143YP40_9LACT|nr:YihY/virulence factor BrkB family protein [Trichococcus palustris]CZQ95426.1 virulence factor brkb [Trichococcus palustris]SFK96597.1 membrane protein [Trichococcus palustris]